MGHWRRSSNFKLKLVLCITRPLPHGHDSKTVHKCPIFIYISGKNTNGIIYRRRHTCAYVFLCAVCVRMRARVSGTELYRCPKSKFAMVKPLTWSGGTIVVKVKVEVHEIFSPTQFRSLFYCHLSFPYVRYWWNCYQYH